jgi:hypothetical protein
VWLGFLFGLISRLPLSTRGRLQQCAVELRETKRSSRTPEPWGRKSRKAWPLQTAKRNRSFAAPRNSRDSRDNLVEVLVAKTPFLDQSPGGHSNVLEKRSDESRRLEKYPQVFVL